MTSFGQPSPNRAIALHGLPGNEKNLDLALPITIDTQPRSRARVAEEG